jgi:drug/metabolite transporter (DMT)-like permease
VTKATKMRGGLNAWRGHAWVASGAFLWGLWALFVRPSGLSGPATAVLAMVGMSLGCPWAIPRERARPRARRAMWLLGLADAGTAGFYFMALVRGPIAIAVLTHYLAPVLVALLAPVVLGEKPSPLSLWASLASLGGLALLLSALPPGGDWGLTAFYGGLSAVFYAANVFTSKEAIAGYTPFQVATLHSPLTVGVLLLAFRGQAIPHGTVAGIAWMMTGAVLCGLVGTSLFNVGLERISTQSAGALTYLEPWTATWVAWMVFGERLTLLSLLGALVILVSGVYVVTERLPAVENAKPVAHPP